MIKVKYHLGFAFVLITTSLLMFTGCEFDVTSPLWEGDYQNPPTPQITQVEPTQRAAAGVNFITIYGENFLDVPDTNGVLFDNVAAEIVSKSTTEIVVRRPNLVADSCIIKVVPNQTLVVAKYSPYQIDPVFETYGAFLDNLALSVAAVDGDENLYVVETASKDIIKETPDGTRTTIGTVSRVPADAIIGPDGRLYLTANHREILVVDLQTGVSSRWIQLATGRLVRCGDFDDNGYFYTGGRRSQLVVVNPGLTDIATGYYANDEIFSIRIYQNYVYLAVKIATPDAQNPELAIWRHTLDGNGNVGERELYLDLTGNEEISSRTINSLYFSADGTLYLGTDATDPLLFSVPGSNTVDYFYKNILPANCKHFCWGNANHIYMISDDPNWNPSLEWNVYQIDMGSNKAP